METVYSLIFTEEVTLDVVYMSLTSIGIYFFLFITIKYGLQASLRQAYRKTKKRGVKILSNSLRKFPLLLGLVLSTYAGITVLPLNDDFLFFDIIYVLTLMLLLLTLTRIFNYTVKDYGESILGGMKSTTRKNYVLYTSVLIRSGIWLLLILFFLTNIGVELTTIITALGLSGFVLAIAFRNLLKDILASFVIVLDRIVEVGDRIKVSDEIGTVSRIGIKSSRLVTNDGLEIILPNTHLVDKKVQNFNDTEEPIKHLFNITVGIKNKEDIRDAVKVALKYKKKLFEKNYKINLQEVSSEIKLYQLELTEQKDHLLEEPEKITEAFINDLYAILSPKDELVVIKQASAE